MANHTVTITEIGPLTFSAAFKKEVREFSAKNRDDMVKAKARIIKHLKDAGFKILTKKAFGSEEKQNAR